MSRFLKKSATALLFIFGFLPWSFAQEQITITTYYPSPFGSYRELTAHRMKVGRTYSDADNGVDDDNLVVEGRVGIGTTSPTVNLQIVNAAPMISLLSSEAGNQELLLEAFNNEQSIIGTTTNNPLAFQTNATERMRIDTAGNIGIGTTGPAARLEIDKAGTDFFTAIFQHTAASSGSGLFFYQRGAATPERAAILANSSSNTTGEGGANALVIRNNISAPILLSTAGTERLRITGAGRICIGITAPRSVTLPDNSTKTAALDISSINGLVLIGGTGDTAPLILNKGGGNVVNATGASDINFSANGGIAATSGMYFFIDSDDTTNNRGFHFRHNGENVPNTDGAELMVIKENGNVGIGTTNPNSDLQVAGGYIQIPSRNGSPPASACDSDSDAGRMIVRRNGTESKSLYVCRGADGWVEIGGNVP